MRKIRIIATAIVIAIATSGGAMAGKTANKKGVLRNGEIPIKCIGPNFSKFRDCYLTLVDGVPIGGRGSGGKATYGNCDGRRPVMRCYGRGEVVIDFENMTIYQ